MSGLLQTGVPPQPKFLLFIKFAILFLSLVILAVAAYAVSLFGTHGYVSTGAGGLLIFVTIKTLIIFGGVTAIEFYAPQLFYRIIAVVAYIISIIFWLSAWAWAASSASAWLSLELWGIYDGAWKSEGSALAALAAFGAVVWVLSIVHLAFFVQACLADPQGTSTQNQAELGQVKVTPPQQPQQYPQQYPQQQHYVSQ